MNTNEMNDKTKVLLLLGGRFGGFENEKNFKALTTREFNRLEEWLEGKQLQLSDLPNQDIKVLLGGSPLAKNTERIQNLLARGSALAITVEKWFNKGIWLVCRGDGAYPSRLVEHLGEKAPLILYGIGDMELLSRGGLAIVGSRNVDQHGEKFTEEVAISLGMAGEQVVSGGARGVDQTAMLAAMKAGGTSVGVLADSLIKASVSGKYRNFIREKQLTLVSPFYPDAHFNAGNAMARNKYIYALADFALIVDTSFNKGGTWAGATEELKKEKHKPVFVHLDEHSSAGNLELKKLGAIPFQQKPWGNNLMEQLRKIAREHVSSVPKQPALFGDIVTVESAAAENGGQYTVENDPVTSSSDEKESSNNKI